MEVGIGVVRKLKTTTPIGLFRILFESFIKLEYNVIYGQCRLCQFVM